jgi:hypothetical protein
LLANNEDACLRQNRIGKAATRLIEASILTKNNEEIKFETGRYQRNANQRTNEKSHRW